MDEPNLTKNAELSQAGCNSLWNNYLHHLAATLPSPQVCSPVWVQFRQMQALGVAYSHQKLPQHLLPVGLSVDFLAAYPQYLAFDEALGQWRKQLSLAFGLWHCFAQAWVDDVAAWLQLNHKRHICELFCGNAAVAASLAKKGFDVVASDNLDWQNQAAATPSPWYSVIQADAQLFVSQNCHHFDTIIWAWAPDTSPIDWLVYQKLIQCDWHGTLVVVGEKMKSSGSHQFWQNAKLRLLKKLNDAHKPLDLICDRVWVAEL